MSKQTFTTGQVLTAAQVNALQSNDFNQTVSVKTAAYTLVAADKGTRIEFNTSGSVTVTVNTGLFDAGDTLVIQNRGAGAVTVTAGTATVNTSATLVLSQYDAGTLYFISASAAIFFNTDAGGGSPLTTKGDLYGFSTLDARIPIGANATVLTADSNESLGLKWAAPASPSFVGCSLFLTGNSTLTGATDNFVAFNNESYDTDGFHSLVTNTSRITIPSGKAGKYLLIGVSFPDSSVTFNRLRFFKNGSAATDFGVATASQFEIGSGTFINTASVIVSAVVNDYFEFSIVPNATITAANRAQFQAAYLGA